MHQPHDVDVATYVQQLKGNPRPGRVLKEITMLQVVPGDVWVAHGVVEGLVRVLCVEKDCGEAVARFVLKVSGGRHGILGVFLKAAFAIIRRAKTVTEVGDTVHAVAVILKSTGKTERLVEGNNAGPVMSQFYERFLMLSKADFSPHPSPPHNTDREQQQQHDDATATPPSFEHNNNNNIATLTTILGANGEKMQIPRLALQIPDSPTMTLSPTAASPTRVMRLVRLRHNAAPALSNYEISQNDLTQGVGGNGTTAYQRSLMKLAHTVGQLSALKDVSGMLKIRRETPLPLTSCRASVYGDAGGKFPGREEEEEEEEEAILPCTDVEKLREDTAFILSLVRGHSLDLAMVELDTIYSAEVPRMAVLEDILMRAVVNSPNYTLFLARWTQLFARCKSQTYPTKKFLRLLSDYLAPHQSIRNSLVLPAAVEMCMEPISKCIVKCIRHKAVHPTTAAVLRVLTTFMLREDNEKSVVEQVSAVVHDNNVNFRWLLGVSERIFVEGGAEVVDVARFWTGYLKFFDGEFDAADFTNLEQIFSPYNGAGLPAVLRGELFEHPVEKKTVLELILTLAKCRKRTIFDKDPTTPSSYARLHLLTAMRMYHSTRLMEKREHPPLCALHLKCLSEMVATRPQIIHKLRLYNTASLFLSELNLEHLMVMTPPQPSQRRKASTTPTPCLPTPMLKPLVPPLKLLNTLPSTWGVALQGSSSVSRYDEGGGAASSLASSSRSYMEYRKARPIYQDVVVHSWVVVVVLLLSKGEGGLDSEMVRILSTHVNHEENQDLLEAVFCCVDSAGDEWGKTLLKMLVKRLKISDWVLSSTDASSRVGAGGFGSVYMGEIVWSGVRVAVKQIQLNERNFVEVLEEVSIMLKLKGTASCLELIDFGFLESNVMCLVTPLWSTTLQAYRKAVGVPKKIGKLFKKILEAVSGLHVRKIIHCDLKSANILYDAGSGEICVADFGEAMSLESGKTSRPRGTECVRPPEVVRTYQKDFDRRAMKGWAPGTCIDVWGLGCLVYEIFVGEFIFESCGSFGEFFTYLTQADQAAAPVLPQPASDKLSRYGTHLPEYTSRFLVRSPCKRPTVADLIPLPFPETIPTTTTPTPQHISRPTPRRRCSTTLCDLNWIVPPAKDPSRLPQDTRDPILVSKGFYISSRPIWGYSIVHCSRGGFKGAVEVEQLGAALVNCLGHTTGLPSLKNEAGPPPGGGSVKDKLQRILYTAVDKAWGRQTPTLVVGDDDRPLAVAAVYLVRCVGLSPVKAVEKLWNTPTLLWTMHKHGSRKKILALLSFLGTEPVGAEARKRLD